MRYYCLDRLITVRQKRAAQPQKPVLKKKSPSRGLLGTKKLYKRQLDLYFRITVFMVEV